MWIVEQEKLGRSRADVETELMAKYGESIRQAPKPKGRGLLAYLLPAGLALAGAAVAAVFLGRVRSGRAGGGAPPATAEPEDPALAKRLDDELAEFDVSHSDV
jgi:cytochrome c-type biogenesis protein CcmH/NrfF